MTPDEQRAWQEGGPTPAGALVACSGCRDCEREGHVKLNDHAAIKAALAAKKVKP